MIRRAYFRIFGWTEVMVDTNGHELVRIWHVGLLRIPDPYAWAPPIGRTIGRWLH